MGPASKIPLLSEADLEVIEKPWVFQLQSSAGLWVSSGMLTYTGNQKQ